MMSPRIFQVGAVALTLVWIYVLVSKALFLTGGHFTYTLDDPYIHLAVAENILRGGYGVNLEEFSAPSSSVLYPFLLAGLLFLGVGDWAPLVLGIIGSVISTWILAGVLWTDTTKNWQNLLLAILALPFLLLTASAFALPLTGMEHTLHVALTLMVVVGIWQLARDKPVPIWFIAAVAFVPLIRFEGLAIFVAALAAMLWYRKFIAAGIAAVIMVSILALFMVMLVQNGMPLLPSSVMVKAPSLAAVVGAQADVPSFGEQVFGFADDLQSNLREPRGLIFSFAIILLAFGMSVRGPNFERRLILSLAISSALLGHAAVGQYGWFGRYEVYAIAMLCTGLILLYRDFLQDLTKNLLFKILGVLCFLAIASAPYISSTNLTPAASYNIYSQQFQMHRFVTEYFPGTVAVNDLGYVAYQNDNHVLDLWGLGSEKARKVTVSAGGRTPEGLQALTDDFNVPLAMVYEDWFDDSLPQEWCKIAVLRTIAVTSASGEVAFYLIDKSRRADLDAALDAFIPTLPNFSTMTRFECP